MVRRSPGLGRSPLTKPLAALCAVLAAIVGYQLSTSVDTSPIAPSEQQVATQAGIGDLATALDSRSAADFGETVRRPIFNSDRKPVVRPRAQREDTARTGSSADLRLVGIVKSSGAPGRALIRVAGEPNGKWMAEGEVVNGWRLRAVKDRSVVVEASGRSQEIGLQVVPRQAEEADDQTEGTPTVQPQPATKAKSR